MQWNGTALTTTFVSSLQLTAAVPANLIASAGNANITAVNTGGSPSTAATLPINAPTPAITSLSPASATAGGAAFTLTVNGTSFLSGATVQWNGTALTTTFVSSVQLTAAVPANLIASAGSANITAVNTGGSASAAAAFPINAPTPTITSLSPTSATAGEAAFTLTVNGTSFLAGATVQWNGTALTTTFVSSTQLTAAVPASLIASAGSANITAINTGGSASAAVALPINAPTPTITSLSPVSATAGGAAFTLTVNGTNFLSGAAVQWNGTALTDHVCQHHAVDGGGGCQPDRKRRQRERHGGKYRRNCLGGSHISHQRADSLAITSLSPASATAGGGAVHTDRQRHRFPCRSGGAMERHAPYHDVRQFYAVDGGGSSQLDRERRKREHHRGESSASPSTAAAFPINAPIPSITSLSPTSATAGGSAFTLTVNGTSFLSGATVQWNGTALTTTFVSSVQLTAAVPANLIASAGSASIAALNTSGSPSAAAAFPVNAPTPTITSLSPTSATAGEGAFTLTVNGTSFLAGAPVQWNGTALTTTFVSTTQLTAAVPASLIASAGSASITAINTGGSASAPVALPLICPRPSSPV